MTFKPLLIIIAFFAANIFAVPSGSRISRTPYSPRSKPLQRVRKAGGIDVSQYSNNWAGAVWANYSSGSFDKVTGTFTVPTPSAPDGSASAWVGIDGSSCNNVTLQTGVTINYQGGNVSYAAWYEWLPDVSHNFDNFDINSGDDIRLTVTASSNTSGTALIENLTSGKNVSQVLTSSSPLCQQDAEWIVEDFSTVTDSGSTQVPFCNFGSVTFADSGAYLSNGTAISPYGATVYNILQQGQVLTSVSIDEGGGVVISYVPT